MYQYGYQLYDDIAPNLRMHQTIQDALNELSDWIVAGTPTDDQALEGLVLRLSRRHHLDGVLYQDDYVAEALRHVRQVWELLRAGQSGTRTLRQPIVVERPAGSIAVRVDCVEQTEAGTRYLQLKSCRSGDKDHLSTRIMLYSLAAQTRHPDASLAIHYTALDRTQVIEHRTGVLEGHTKEIDAVLAGIAAQFWPPKFGDECQTCPFNLICPV